MSPELLLLAVLMGAVTYPSRAIPLLVPAFERLPATAFRYLRLVGPAILASLAASGVLFASDQPGLRIGIELLAVAACVAIVAAGRSLLIGMLVAVAMVALARAAGLA